MEPVLTTTITSFHPKALANPELARSVVMQSSVRGFRSNDVVGPSLDAVRKSIRTFWREEVGVVDASGYLLMVAILCIGMVVALEGFRSQVVQNLGDIVVSLESLNQSYSFSVGTTTSVFNDTGTGTITDVSGDSPAGISLHTNASHEQ